QGAGDWSSWCGGTPASPVSDVCGPAWDEFDDTQLPTVAITSPVWGDTFPAGSAIDILIDAAKLPDGFAINEVRLHINGSDVASDLADPYAFIGAQFSNEGVYTMVAVAEDWAGNIVESDPVAIGIGDAEVPPEPEPEPEPSETGGEDDPGTGDDLGAGDQGRGGDEGGCACNSTPSSPSPWWLFAGLGLLGLRRRRL